MRIQEEEEDNLDIPLASLMDAMFILIIFFVVTTTMKKVHRELPLELPPSAVAVSRVSSTEVLVLSVDAEGNKYVNSEPVTTTGLLDSLREAALADPNRRVRIDADRDTRYSAIVEVIEAAHFQGLYNVGFRTRNPDAKPSP
jgi:biopolymer transport protein ExbD